VVYKDVPSDGKPKIYFASGIHVETLEAGYTKERLTSSGGGEMTMSAVELAVRRELTERECWTVEYTEDMVSIDIVLFRTLSLPAN